MTERLCTRRRLKTFVALAVFLILVVKLSFWPSTNLNPIRSKNKPPEPSRVLDSLVPEDSPLSKPIPPVPERPLPPQEVKGPTESETASSGVCKGFSKDLDVVIVVKTGATEASRRLPHQLASFLACAKDDVLVFSDMEQEISDVHVYDCLDEIAEEALFNNTDFNLYRDQKQHVLEGQDIGRLSSRAGESWVLDKYKNIHTAQKAWKMRPEKSWYFFIDVDTYVVWSSLFAYLKQFDASKKYYLGAEVPSELFPFAHGGSGYAVSRGALQTLVGEDAKQIARDFDTDVKNICCGDIEFSKSLHDKGILITDSHPLINGDRPNNYRIGPKMWCKPLITMHHIGAEEMNDIWQFERSRKNPEEPLLFGELWNDFLEPKLPSRRADWDKLSEEMRRMSMPAEREDWDNFSEDWTFEPPKEGEKESLLDWAKLKDPHVNSYESIEKCAQACKEKAECFQYLYSEKKCQLQKSFRFGQKREPDKDKGLTWKSGWDLDKIKKFKEDNSPCKKVDFTTYHQ